MMKPNPAGPLLGMGMRQRRHIYKRLWNYVPVRLLTADGWEQLRCPSVGY